jgi:peptide/nickel transport system substrate-binding protein
MSDAQHGIAGALTRRGFLTGVAGTAGLLAVAGCSSNQISPSAAVASSKPRVGGTLRVGILGGSSSDTVQASAPVGVPDFARLASLYNPLATLDVNGNVVPVLAESIDVSPDASVYTIRLRQGVTFHNGRPLTPQDVIFSLHRIVSQHLDAATTLTGLNFHNIKVMDSHTLRITLDRPSVLFNLAIAAQGSPVNIVPVGYNPKKPIGTGPFKFQSFTPGQRSVFVRNPNYFKQGLPYLDTLEIIDYPDANARFNAFISGQLDAIDAVPTAQLPTLKGHSGSAVLQASTGLALTNYMRTDVAPFNDPDVRLAMKLMVDRQKMIEVAGAGLGSLGDDVWGKGFPSYDSGLPQRKQDIDQAKFLLKKGGHDGMTVQLSTANFSAGATEQAALMAQFASAAGFKININQTSEANLFGKNYVSSGYKTSWPFAQDFFSGGDYLYQAGLTMAKGAQYNETHFSNTKFDALFTEANSTADNAKRYDLIHEMQQIDYITGGWIISYYGVVIDAYSTRFTGFQHAAKTGYSFNNYDFSAVRQA